MEVCLMGFVGQEGRTTSMEHEQVPHPDRVSWYAALIQEWTTQVWASSVEEAVEELCNFVYEDVQADAWRVLGSESWSGGR